MTGAPRGWCPGVHQPMPLGDGLMVRVKPHAGVLSAVAAAAFADAAARAGCASALLTCRANLQLRGLTARAAAAFAQAMVACGLAAADPAHERRRNLIVSPLAGIDPACDPATRAVADAIAAGLADPRFAGLPDKFGFAVDGGGAMPLGRVRGDVRVAAAAGAWLVWADGAAEAHVCAAGDAASVALDLAARRPPTKARGRTATAAPALPDALGLAVLASRDGLVPLDALAVGRPLRLTPWRLAFAEPPA